MKLNKVLHKAGKTAKLKKDFFKASQKLKNMLLYQLLKDKYFE